MIVVIGDVMIDRYVQGTIERISPEAPVPVLRHDNDKAAAGGAANVAVNIVALGGQAELIGLVGADGDADALQDLLLMQGVRGSRLVVDPDRPTTSKTRVMSGSHQVVRVDRESSAPPSPQVASKLMAVVAQAVAKADIVVLSDYAKGCLAGPLVGKIIALARAAGCYVIVDPKRVSLHEYRGSDLIKPNRRELAAATGMACRTDAEVEAATARLCRDLGTAILVTRDEAGMSLARPDAPTLHVPTTVQEVADVSGAGDTALAALAVALAEGVPIERAVEIANISAGIAVGKVGTAAVFRPEVEAAIARAETPLLHPGALVRPAEAAEIAAAWRRSGQRVVFTNGCFDLLHSGHVTLLAAASAEGDRLIVGLNSDASVRRLKGPTRPVQTDVDRAKVLGSLRSIDLIVIFDEDTPLRLIQAIAPDVLVKGADYRADDVVGSDFVTRRGGRVALVDLVEGQSSTRLIARARI
jgi:D-beta-D-heptose 7-phosphate kinase/D-beta-D-heptose 1-phosphate adenosyltransferase